MTATEAQPARSSLRRTGCTIGVVGKGGVGKTTVAGLLARILAEDGRRVVAIDTDSNPNLGLSLGLSLTETESVPVLPRTAVVGRTAPVAAAELVSSYGRRTPTGPTLLSALKVTDAGAGCTCSGHATVRSLLAQALDDVDVTVVDMEAGLEHLSRSGGTLAHADVLLVVCEPTRKSVLTAARTAPLAAELGIPRLLGVGNKSRGPDDEDFFRAALDTEGIPLAGVVPLDPQVAEADRTGATGPPPVSPAVRAALRGVLTAVDATAGAMGRPGSGGAPQSLGE